MKYSLTTLVLLIVLAGSLRGQDYIGVNIGYGIGDYGEGHTSVSLPMFLDDTIIIANYLPHRNLNFGIIANFEISKSFDLKISPQYKQFGAFRLRKPGEEAGSRDVNPLSFEKKYLNCLAIPLEIRWKFLKRKLQCSLNGGVGLVFLMDGTIERYTFDANVLKLESVSLAVEELEFKKQAIFGILSLDINYIINENFLIGFNLHVIQSTFLEKKKSDPQSNLLGFNGSFSIATFLN